jgi:predicted NBD/HSP70 family sugar kinase
VTPEEPNFMPNGPGALLGVIRRAGTITRTELVAETGLPRSTLVQRVDALLDRGLLRVGSAAPSTGGRRAATLEFNAEAGVVLGVDLGATHARAALFDLGGQQRAEVTGELDIRKGPDTVLDWVDQASNDLLAQTATAPDALLAIGVGVPGPVEFASGRPVRPPIMPGWDDYDIPGRLAGERRIPVLVDNDVNIMALGEQWTSWPSADHLLCIKAATGIGCGIIIRGQIHRGAQGAAGDIGHVRLAGHDDIICECGNVGCLEAVAGGRALARAATQMGLDAHGSRDVVELVHTRVPEVIALVRQAGRDLGTVLAGLVNALNPSVIVLGGDLAVADEHLLAGVREIVYQRSTTLATRQLQIARSALDDRAAVIGAGVMAIEHVLDPAVVDRELRALAAV